MVLTVGSGTWRSIGRVSKGLYTKDGVFHNGFLHWICRCKRSHYFFIRAFDVESEHFKILPLPPSSLDWEFKENPSEIGVLKGSLAISYGVFDTFSVWVMKDNGIHKSWTKDLEIRDTIDSNGEPITREHICLVSRVY